uniref:Uncharacterized protein n=1 Tax=viral metagenome TaxID=1070528 RepID=A0A6M3JZT6_9ZZZZ
MEPMTMEEIADEIEVFCEKGRKLFKFLIRYTNAGTDRFLHTESKPYPSFNMVVYARKNRLGGVVGVGRMEPYFRSGKFLRGRFERDWAKPETTTI